MSLHREYFIIFLFLSIGLLTRSVIASLYVSYFAVTVSFVVVFIPVYSKRELIIEVDNRVLLFLACIYTIYILNLLRTAILGSPSIYVIVKVGAFVVFTSLALLLLPSLTTLDNYLWALSRVSFVVVLLGIPTAFFGAYSIFGISVTPYIWDFNLPLPLIQSSTISPITSIMDNPNVFGFLASVGFASSTVDLENQTRRALPMLVIGVTGTGAYLSGSRAAVLSIIVFSVVYLAYRFVGRQTAAMCVVGVLVTLVYFLLFNFSVFPGPEVLRVNLRGREYLWVATWDAVRTKPILGFGAGDQVAFIKPFLESGQDLHPPHNSYLRMFLNTGMVGGMLYVLFTVYVVSRSFDARFTATMVGLVTIITIHQLFAGFSIFGLAANSIISAVTFGYVLRVDSNENDEYQEQDASIVR